MGFFCRRLTIDDITRLKVGAIVNAANASRRWRGLTAPSIGPPGLRAYGRMPKTKECPPEEARLSGGYRLPARISSTRLALSGRLGQQILEICYRSCICISDHISRKSNCRVGNLC
jgi:hypothetical protein